MPYTLYDAAVVGAQDALGSLEAIVNKAEASPDAEKILSARLHADMNPFTFQIHSATRSAHTYVASLMGTQDKNYVDDLKTYADLHARIAEVQSQLKDADKEVINARGDELIPMDLRGGRGVIDLEGWKHVHGNGLPNMLFHVNIAYGIVRMSGVEIGKFDYIKPFGWRFVEDKMSAKAKEGLSKTS